MKDYSITFSANDNLSDVIKKLKKQMGDMAKESGKAADDIDKQFNKIVSSSAPVEKQLKGLQKLLSEMEFKGLAGTEQFNRIAQEAGAMSDAIQDAREAVKRFSSDTAILDGVVSAFQGVSAGISVATGALGLFGVKNEDVQRTILKVQSALTMLNGVQQIANVLNKNSAAILSIKTMQTKLATSAIMKNTAATKAQTVAQKALNLVIKANPYGILITAIGLATTAFFTFGDSAEEARQKLGQLEDGSNDLLTVLGRQREYDEQLAQKTSELVSEYDKLRIQWVACGNDADKQNKFIKSLGDNFFVLGTRVNDSASAMQMFIDKAPEVRKAYMYIASIEAAQNVYKKMMEQSLGNLLQNLPPIDYASMGTQFRTEYDSNGGMVIPKNLREMGFTQNDLKLKYDNLGGHWSFTSEAAVKKYNDAMDKSAKDAIGRAANIFNDTQKTGAKYLEDFIKNQIALFDSLGLGTYQDYMLGQSGKNKLPPPPKPDKVTTPKVEKISQPKQTIVKAKEAKKEVEKQLTELQELEKKRAELQTYLKRADLTEYERFSKEEELKKLDDEISLMRNWTKERAYVFELPDDAFVFDYNGALDNALKEFQKNLQKTLKDADIVGVVPLKLLSSTVQNEKGENIKQRGLLGPLQEARVNLYSANTQSINQIKEWFNDGLLTQKEAETFIARLNEQLKTLQLDPIEIDLDTEKFIKKAVEAGNTVNKVASSVSTAFSALNDLYKADSGEDDRGLMIGKIIAQAVANIALSFSEAMAKHKSATVWDWIAAGIAGTANLIAMIAQVKQVTNNGYAEGGIIGGNSYYGDRMLVRTNSGEMILNKRQQSNLFKMISNGFSGGGGTGNASITMKVRGSDIYASLKNYGKLQHLKTIS